LAFDFWLVDIMRWKDVWNRPNRLPEIYGTLIALGLVVYFLLMWGVGLVNVIELRLLNLVIVGTGIYFALKQHLRTHNNSLGYFEGFVVCVGSDFIGVTTFGFFLFAALMVSEDLSKSVLGNEPMAEHLDPYIATAVVMIEGVFSGFFMTFILLNWLNTDTVNNPNKREQST